MKSFVPTQAILPTLLDLTGIDVEREEGWVPSLAPLLESDSEDAYEAATIAGANRVWDAQWAVVVDGFKYLRIQSGREELYDLKNDPEERDSARADQPEIVQRARSILDEHFVFARRLLESEPAPTGDAEVFGERLRSLGYIR